VANSLGQKIAQLRDSLRRAAALRHHAKEMRKLGYAIVRPIENYSVLPRMQGKLNTLVERLQQLARTPVTGIYIPTRAEQLGASVPVNWPKRWSRLGIGYAPSPREPIIVAPAAVLATSHTGIAPRRVILHELAHNTLLGRQQSAKIWHQARTVPGVRGQRLPATELFDDFTESAHRGGFRVMRKRIEKVAKRTGIWKEIRKLGYALQYTANRRKHPHVFAMCPRCNHEWSAPSGVRIGAVSCPLCGSALERIPSPNKGEKGTFYTLERRSQYDPENVRTLEKEMRQHNVPSRTRLQWHSRVFGGSGGLKSEDIYKISRKKEAKKGVYIFPYVKTAPPEVNRILEETYRRHRKDLSSRVNAGDLTERESKQQAAIASWAAVKRAGYRKVKKPMNVWEKQQQYAKVGLFKKAGKWWKNLGRNPYLEHQAKVARRITTALEKQPGTPPAVMRLMRRESGELRNLAKEGGRSARRLIIGAGVIPPLVTTAAGVAASEALSRRRERQHEQQYAIPESAQTQALWGQTRQRWLKHGRMPKALMVPTSSGRFVRVKTVFPTSEPAARASSPSVRRKLLNNPQVREEMADLVAGSIHEAGHAPTPERRMVRFKKKPTGHLTSALLVGGGAAVGGAHLARKRRREQEQKQYARFANVREGFPIMLSELGFSKYPRAAALAKKAMTAGMLASNEVRVRTPRAGSIRRLFGKWANQGTPAFSLTPRFNASVKVSPRYTTDQQMQRLTKRVSGGEVKHKRRLLQIGKGLMNPQTSREFEKVARSWYSPDELAGMSHQGESVVQYSVKGFTSWLGKHPNLLLSAAAGSVTAAHLRRMWREHQEKRMQERYSLLEKGHQALDGIKSGFKDSRPLLSDKPWPERMGRTVGAWPNELLVGVKNTAARIPGGIAKGTFLMGLGLVLAKLLERGSQYWPGAPVVRADVEGLEPYYLRLARYYTRRLCAEGSEQELHYAAAATGGFAAKARNAFLRHAVSFLAGMISAELLGRGFGRKKETHQLEHTRQPREHYVMRARTVPRHGMHLIPPARIAEGEARSILRSNKRQIRSAGLRKAAKLGVPVVLLSGGVGYLGLRKKRDSELAKQYQVASWLGKAGKWLGIGAAKAAKSPWGAGVIPKGMRGAKQAAYVERMFGVPKPSTMPWTQRAMKVMKENPMIPAFGAMTAAPLLIPGPEQRVRHIYDEEK